VQKQRLIAHFRATPRGTLSAVPVDRKAQPATIDPDRSVRRLPQQLYEDPTTVNPASAKAIRMLGWLTAGVLMSQAVCLPALATLGEDVTTVENDRLQMKAQLRTTSVAGYTVHEIQTPANTVVREYVAPSGKVFAVSWSGPLLPDFRQTLGRYFDDYNSGASAPRAGRRHLSIERTDLVVNSYGRMRAFYGNAYVPSLLPANFSVADIK
jgi:hypothetical protein